MKKHIFRHACRVLFLAIIALAFKVPNNTSCVRRRQRFRVPYFGGTIIADDINSIQSIESSVNIKAAELQLNQRKLTRQMKQIRSDSRKALELLGSVYHHLTIPMDEIRTIEDEIDLSYEQLVDILYRDSGILSDSKLPVVIDGKSTSMALEVLCKARNISAAMMLLNRSVHGVIHNRKLRMQCQDQSSDLWQDEESDNNELCTIYKAILSTLGRSQSQSTSSSDQMQRSAVYSNLTLHLLLDHMPSIAKIQPGLALYHAALNALGRNGNHEAISTLLSDMKDPAPDRMAYQIAISSLAKCGKCLDAVRLLNGMRLIGLSPDISTYNELLIGIAKTAGKSGENEQPISWHKLALEILQDIESQDDLVPTDQTYNSIISVSGKEKAWDVASLVARKASNSTILSGSIGIGENTEQTSSYFSHLDAFHKNGRGNYAYWDIAEYSNGSRTPIIIGIQPHRNPRLNGISLVFYQNDLQGNRVKVGRVLLKNDCIPSTKFYQSSIIGMEVNANMRGAGLSKILIAIWIDICLQTGAFPRAAVMNKPLIALVLAKFGFIADEGGTKCALVRLENDEEGRKFGLYSSSRKILDGALSHRVLRTQNIKILRSLPDSLQKSAEVVIKTTFSHPVKPPDGNRDSNTMELERSQLEEKIDTTLKLSGDTPSEMKYFSSKEVLTKAFLFF